MKLVNRGCNVTATLDTNLLLRLTLRDVPEQYEAVRDLLTAPGARYRVTDIAISEMVHALIHHYGLDRTQVALIIRAVIWDSSIETSKELLDKVVGLFETSPWLSYIDCYMAEEAQATNNTPLLTFDRALVKKHKAAHQVHVGY
jgi:predicted nucleic acid-binding protein